MSLRKSPTRTPAFLEAIRRNAQKSTGPWTVRGKAQSCLNRLKTGEGTRVYRHWRSKNISRQGTKARQHKENKAPLRSSGGEGKIKRC